MVGHYPIRMSRPSWDIKLSSKHECGAPCLYECVQILNDDMSVDIVLQMRSSVVNGRCPCSGKVIRSQTIIDTFDEHNPRCVDGPLMYSGDIVVPDQRIKVRLTYPLRYPYEAVLTSPTADGFTLASLLSGVQQCYRDVYAQEERTAPHQTFHLSKMCMDCMAWNANKKIEPCSPKCGDECSICVSAMDSGAARTKCGHVFHANCLLEWMDHGLNCPICRTPLHECNQCNGTYVVYFDYTGAVVPLEHRQLLRNTTHGQYGIHTLYLEDITVSTIHYDRINKVVTVE